MNRLFTALTLIVLAVLEGRAQEPLPPCGDTGKRYFGLCVEYVDHRLIAGGARDTLGLQRIALFIEGRRYYVGQAGPFRWKAECAPGGSCNLGAGLLDGTYVRRDRQGRIAIMERYSAGHITEMQGFDVRTGSCYVWLRYSSAAWSLEDGPKVTTISFDGKTGGMTGASTAVLLDRKWKVVEKGFLPVEPPLYPRP